VRRHKIRIKKTKIPKKNESEQNKKKLAGTFLFFLLSIEQGARSVFYSLPRGVD
jgi:hypothetical protein